MARRSLRAVSKLRAESHETKPMTKKPMIAGTLGLAWIDKAMTEIMTPLNALKMKLDQGLSRMLAMMIGMVKANKLRPPDTSWGVSVNAKTIVRKARNMEAATCPDQLKLIK